MGHERLRRHDDVRTVLRRGRRRSSDGVVVHARARDDDGPARVATVASRRVGGAVQRNRAKRVLRAAAADVVLPRGVDFALVARASTPASSSREITSQLRDVIEHMFGVATGEGPHGDGPGRVVSTGAPGGEVRA